MSSLIVEIGGSSYTLAISNVTGTSADFTWAAGGTETAWNVEYGAAGFTQGYVGW